MITDKLKISSMTLLFLKLKNNRTKKKNLFKKIAQVTKKKRKSVKMNFEQN